MVEVTKYRDEDQAITRFQAQHTLTPPILATVDQLWVWVLDLGYGQKLSPKLGVVMPSKPWLRHPQTLTSKSRHHHGDTAAPSAPFARTKG